MNQFQRSPARGVVLIAVLSFLLLGAVWVSPAAAGFTSGQATITYRVRTDDTLWTISQRLAVSPSRLAEENGHPSVLQVGQRLYVTASVSDNTFPYRVQPGDSLYLISRRLGRSVDSIAKASHLTSHEIHPGQMLRIPLAESDETLHRVQRGESLFGLSRQYQVPAEAVVKLNWLSTDEIRIGQALRIPRAENQAPPGVTLYRVRPGDTLNHLSAQYATTVWAIKETNGLVSSRLMPGQPLYIPAGSSLPAEVSPPQGEQVDGYGRLLEWEWARWYYPPGTQATVTDFYTGRSFEVVRLGGSNHADSEPATARDTEVMRAVFGGRWSWHPRPIFLTVRGQKFAASMNSMPHDVQTIYHNNFAGHFCLYFYQSRTHRTNSLHADHQFNVLRAAGHR